MRLLPAASILCVALLIPASGSAQQAPEIGYMYPPGGAAGTTVDVVLGGYDWTPDMQVFVLDPRIGLEITAPPGPVIVPEPPYWFGKKARRSPFPLPRETKARLTVAADFPLGIVEWQAANANGATGRGRFVVGSGNEVIEIQERTSPQQLSGLPVTVSGRIQKIEEVDRYRFTPDKSGPVTCRVIAQKIGSPLNAIIEVRDADGKLVADAADTAGRDLLLTLAAVKETEYTVSIFDSDFRGNRAYVYRLELTPGPGILAAIPAVGKPGETRPIEFVGYGVASGGEKLESVTANVTFPTLPVGDRFQYRLETAHGTASPFDLFIGDLDETVEATGQTDAPHRLTVPAAVTGVIESRYGSDRYVFGGRKGETLSIAVEAARIGSRLDVSLAVFDAAGKQIGTNDDLPGTVDAGVEIGLPEDGDYHIIVTDSSNYSGNRAAVYRLVVRPAFPSFELSAPELLAVPSEGKGQLTVTAKRHGGFKDAISISLTGLPAGVTCAPTPVIPAGQNAVKIELSSAAGSATTAGLIEVSGTATIDEKQVTRTAGRTLVAVTLKPPFSIDAEGKDDVTKWPRGSTFPGPVLIERDAGFDGEIVLEMASKQGRHRQGIRGPELTVPSGVNRMLYPVFLPEWLETTRTSRMVVNGVARVTDGAGNVRYSVSRLKTRIGFLPGGALLKISTPEPEVELQPGEPLDVQVTINRNRELTEEAKLELVQTGEFAGMFQADPLVVTAGATEAILRVAPVDGQFPTGEVTLTVRATVMQQGEYPVVSETTLLLVPSSR